MQATKLPDHLTVCIDGSLSDTRQVNWHKTPLRQNYSRTHREIGSVADYKATLRAGQYAWPGGYQMFLITSDGQALCYGCGWRECRNVMDSIASKSNDGWRCVAVGINYEDSDMLCCHCSEPIPAAYGDDSDDSDD
jgi:hypothetical protein